MVQFRHPRAGEVDRLREIWQLCFGDDISYINLFFENKYKPEQTLLLVQDEEIAAMLTIIPVIISAADRIALPAGMLYAIATHPDYQKKGFARRLIGYANDYLAKNKVPYSLLVPAGKDLFSFYEKLGYREGFTICETHLTREQISGLPETNYPVPGFNPPKRSSPEANPGCIRIEAAAPEEYNSVRNKLLDSIYSSSTNYFRYHVQYRVNEIAYQKKISRFSGADIFLVKHGSGEGCLAAERMPRQKIIFKEFIIGREFLYPALKKAADAFKADEYIVRTPVFMDILPGSRARAFAMIKPTGFFHSGGIIPEERGYLGIAFD